MKRIIKVLVMSALLVVVMATTNVSVASACPWWANECTDTKAFGREECKENDVTGGTNGRGANDDKKGNCGW